MGLLDQDDGSFQPDIHHNLPPVMSMLVQDDRSFQPETHHQPIPSYGYVGPRWRVI
jgi:hypothetical protein